MLIFTISYRKIMLALSIIFFLMLIIVGFSNLNALRIKWSGTIIKVDGTHQLPDLIDALLQKPIPILFKETTQEFFMTDIGIRIDEKKALDILNEYLRWPWWQKIKKSLSGGVLLELPIVIDEELFIEKMTSSFPFTLRLGYEPRLIIKGEEKKFIPGENKEELDVIAVKNELSRILHYPTFQLELPIKEVEPRITPRDLGDLQKWQRLSSFSTNFNSTQSERSSNIKLAASTIDGWILLPGEEFSLNETTGVRGEEQGYKIAPVILDGEMVLGIGGGVSQLASTIFNAALLGGMEITEYHSHSLPVSYLPIGRDATVWYGQLDLRFKNTTPFLIAISTASGTDWVKIELWAAQNVNWRVEVETKLIEVVSMPKEERVDYSLLPGERKLIQTARVGQKILIKQHLRDQNGETLITRELEAFYRPIPEIWAVGR